ncbi:MAG TPA: extracellular solute-binding protein [Ktedonosporobacter sp.]|nr:extracellular solute-binding protein [Ktedonosporobacter sp.]
MHTTDSSDPTDAMTSVLPHDHSYNRRRFLHTAALTSGGLLLAACGGATTPLQATSKATTIPAAQITATIQAAVGKTFFPSGDPNVPDAYTTPPPLVQSVGYVPGSGKTVNAMTVSFNPPPLPLSQNKYWQELNKHLNINWQVQFPAGNDGYTEKAAALLASGDLPDLFCIEVFLAPSLAQALQQGAFTDLTSFLSGDALSAYPNIAKIPPISWKNTRFNGKIYGVPRARPIANGGLFFRLDLIEKVGLAVPKNADEFFQLSQAITQYGKGQAWALGGGGTVFGDGSPMFAMEMFGVPNGWRLETNGTLTHRFQTAEFKAAMLYIRKLYAAGVFHPDYFTQTLTQTTTAFTTGKIAAYVTGMAGLLTARLGTKQVDPQSDVGLLIPAGDKAVAWLAGGHFGYVGIPSSVGGDENRVKELLRILDYFCAPRFSLEGDFLATGIDGWDNTKSASGVKALNATGSKEIGDLAYIENPAPIYYTPAEPTFALKLQGYAKQLQAIGVTDPTAPLYSPTATKKQAQLNQIYNDRFTRFVKGTDPETSVDGFASDFFSTGGTQIKQEFEAQLQKQA